MKMLSIRAEQGGQLVYSFTPRLIYSEAVHLYAAHTRLSASQTFLITLVSTLWWRFLTHRIYCLWYISEPTLGATICQSTVSSSLVNLNWSIISKVRFDCSFLSVAYCHFINEKLYGHATNVNSIVDQLSGWSSIVTQMPWHSINNEKAQKSNFKTVLLW